MNVISINILKMTNDDYRRKNFKEYQHELNQT